MKFPTAHESIIAFVFHEVVFKAYGNPFCRAPWVVVRTGVADVAWLTAVVAEILPKTSHTLPWRELDGAELHGLVVRTRETGMAIVQAGLHGYFSRLSSLREKAMSWSKDNPSSRHASSHCTSSPASYKSSLCTPLESGITVKRLLQSATPLDAI